MAVTLTVAELLAALRMGTTREETAQGTRLLTYASMAVLRQAKNAPAVVQNEAAILLAGYLFDKPFSPGGAGYANAGTNSGAWSILAEYRDHRAGSTNDVEAATSTPGQVNADVVNSLIESAVSAWALGTSAALIPADKLPTRPDAVDQTARASANAAQAAANAAQTTADAAQVTADAAAAGAGGQWIWSSFINGPFVGGVAKAGSLRSFPQSGLATYAELRAAVLDGSVRQVAIRFSENDIGNADNDFGVSVIPNAAGFFGAAGTFVAFPGWQLGQDPPKFTIVFGATGVTAEADADAGGTQSLQVRVGIWA